MTEDEARFILEEYMRLEQRRALNRMKPFMEELVHLHARKPPQPVALADGRVFAYVGPTATDLAGPYRAPEWLEQLAQDDHDLRFMLRRYRERAEAERGDSEG